MYRTAETLILKHFSSEWTSTPIDRDNLRYVPTSGDSWVRIQVEWSETNQKAIGTRKRKGTGFVLVSIFVPKNSGTIISREYADQVAGVFDYWESSPLKFRVSRMRRVGDAKGWHQVNVYCPFSYDECN